MPHRAGLDAPRMDAPENQERQGPNLRLFYSLIALAIAAAIAIAAMIVLPFYRQR